LSDQEEGTPPKRPNLRMRFGAEMNDLPAPPPDPLPPPEQPANIDAEPDAKT
jgi:hypothetical protein